jgi:hypothetical protein
MKVAIFWRIAPCSHLLVGWFLARLISDPEDGDDKLLRNVGSYRDYTNIEILERFQSKVLRMTVDAPWYVPNTVTLRDLQIPTVKEEIRRYSSQYSARLSSHPNVLLVKLIELPDNSQLRR